jgi:uncharacterized protein YkwD
MPRPLSARSLKRFRLAAAWGAAVAALAVGLACDVTGSFGLPGSNASVAGQQGNEPTTTNTTISASLLEQLSLERINRARLRPGQEAAMNGIAIDEGIPGQLNTTPKQPLALNAQLNDAARKHSQDMINRDFFGHVNPSGLDPFQRMQAAGYATFIAAGENLAWRGSTGSIEPIQTVEAEHIDLFVDAGIDGRGHRVTMLNPAFREVGIGIVRGSFTKDGIAYDSIVQTQDFATSPADATIVLGVVYQDANANGRYDYAEGTANVNVTLGSITKVTNAAGGYSFTVNQTGNHQLRFHTGTTRDLAITAGDANIKVDLINGTQVAVNLGLGPLP